MQIQVNWHKKFLSHWMKRNDVEKANICLPFLINEQTDLMKKIFLMGFKYDKTRTFKSLFDIETEMGCGIFEVIIRNKNEVP